MLNFGFQGVHCRFQRVEPSPKFHLIFEFVAEHRLSTSIYTSSFRFVEAQKFKLRTTSDDISITTCKSGEGLQKFNVREIQKLTRSKFVDGHARLLTYLFNLRHSCDSAFSA